MTEQQKEHNLYWAEKFEIEAELLRKGSNMHPGKPINPKLLKAHIDSCLGMAKELRQEVERAGTGMCTRQPYHEGPCNGFPTAMCDIYGK